MWALFFYELKYYFKNKQEAIYLYSYFISILVLMPFAGGADLTRYPTLGVLGLWVSLASAITMAGASVFKREQEGGRLEYYQLLPVALESLVAAKWLAFYGFVTIPLLAAIPVAAALYPLPMAMAGQYVGGLLAGAAGLSILACLVATLTSGLAKAGAVFSLIMLPLTIPVLIFGAGYCLNGEVGHLVFLLGFAAFMLPILCFAGAHAIRASN